MQKLIQIQLIISSIIFASPFRQFRISDPDGKCNIRDLPDSKSGINQSIESGKCLAGEILENDWVRVGLINKQTLVYGFVHKSRLIIDSTCDTLQFQALKCELIEKSLSDVLDFYHFEKWVNKYFETRCDDGYYAESISDFVVSKLSSNWDFELRALQSDYLTQSTRDLIIKHIDETSDSTQFNFIQTKLKACKDDPKHLCKKISQQIRKLSTNKRNSN